MSDVKLGDTVIVRNRTRPAGYQVYPGIVTAIQNVVGTPTISVTGFPGGGAQYTDDKIAAIDVHGEAVVGWYSPDEEAARPALNSHTPDDRGPLSSRARQRAAKESDRSVAAPYVPPGSQHSPTPPGPDHGSALPPII